MAVDLERKRDGEDRSRIARRAFLGRAAAGLGPIALATLLGRRGLAGGEAPAPAGPGRPAIPSDRWPGAVRPLHHPPRAKRVIWLCMAGGPSHFETFDWKPKLAELHGKPMPESFTKGQPIAQLQGAELKCFAPQHPFQRYGRSGQEICELFPSIGGIADDICIIRSMVTEAINHDPAHTFMNTGTAISGRPSMGSWLWYGLGSESEDLPGFVVLTSTGKSGQQQPIASRQWHSGSSGPVPGGALPIEGGRRAVPLEPAGVSQEDQRDVIDAVQGLDRLHDEAVDDPEIAARIAQYEMAFRMQGSVPELMDLSKEPPAVLDLYGTKGGDGSFAANCLLARRLAERGVRFIQLYHRDWDHHGGVKEGIRIIAAEVDRASAALVSDLKARGMLDDTLVVWGASSAGPRWPRATAGTITSRDSRCGWPAAGSGAGSPTGRPTTWGTTPSRTPSTSTTSTPRCSTSSGSTT